MHADRLRLLRFPMRVGLFGGTFDPPHRGHLAVADAAIQAFKLSRVLLAPTGRQPLKTVGAVASFADRMAMARILCSEAAAGFRLEPSGVDAPKQDDEPNYTISAIRRLKLAFPSAEQGTTKMGGIFVIVGADAFRQLRQWREPVALLREAEWIVVSRPGFSDSGPDAPNLSPEQAGRVHRLTSVQEPASSTDIRTRLGAGADCSGLLTPGVIEYIRQHGLYANVDGRAKLL